MLAWSPILVQQIEIHALGFVLRKLQLNRHRETEVTAHRHPYAQLILYLAGEGIQTVQRKRRRAQAGDLFVIPGQVEHGFSVVGKSRPLCLVLDYEMSDGRVRTAYRRLPQATLNELHALLARVPTKGSLTLADYPAILAVVARLLGQSPASAPRPDNVSLFAKVSDFLRAPGSSVNQAARAAGYHPDHLTRRLKKESGLGTRALRDRLRLEAAQTALASSPTVAEAAAQAGFDDPNYFSRWFQRQTGKTPREWRAGNNKH